MCRARWGNPAKVTPSSQENMWQECRAKHAGKFAADHISNHSAKCPGNGPQQGGDKPGCTGFHGTPSTCDTEQPRPQCIGRQWAFSTTFGVASRECAGHKANCPCRLPAQAVNGLRRLSEPRFFPPVSGNTGLREWYFRWMRLGLVSGVRFLTSVGATTAG
jgi:hypothetical protein